MKDKKRLETNSDVGTRTIVVYWAFLVLIGFICIWQQLQYGQADTNLEYPDMSKVMCRPGTNASMLISQNGTSHRRAIDDNFIQQNGCTHPCDQIDIPAIFRQQSQLQLLSHSQALLWNFTLPGPKYQTAEKIQTADNRLLDINAWTLPFILVQGFVPVLFGRRDAREIRDFIYMTLFKSRPSSKPSIRAPQDYFARLLAFLSYIAAVVVVLLCPPLFILTTLAQEWQSWVEQPDSEPLYAVGQWNVWAITCQVLLAALIAHYHDKVISALTSCYRYTLCRTLHRHRPLSPDHGCPSTVNSANTDAESALKPPLLSTSSPTRPTATPLQPPPKQPLTRSLTSHIPALLATLSHPLNQSDRGLMDEFTNFVHWCKDPAAVSQKVIRHPIRPRDARDYAPEDLERREEINCGDQAPWRLDSGFLRGKEMASAGAGPDTVGGHRGREAGVGVAI